MKKIIFSVVIVAAMTLGMSSCKKEQCWEIGTKVPILGFVPVAYFYGTAADADAFIKSEYAGATKQKSKKSESDCKGGLLEDLEGLFD